MILPYVVNFSEQEIADASEALIDILTSGRLILGPYTEAFEASIRALAGVRHAVAVNSGSTALEIIFRALELRGRTVLVPTNTNFATAAAAINAGAHIEFYDSGLYPQLADIERKLHSDVAAVVVVHIGGYVWQGMANLAALCRSASIALIEDAAHAHGSTVDGVPAGGLGDAAAFSFYPTKVITTGEGGMLTTNDGQLAESARRYRDQGKADGGVEHIVMGNSWRMTEFGAALGISQMATFDRDRRRRREVIDRYAAELAGNALSFPRVDPASNLSGHKCIAVLDPSADREVLRKFMIEQNVTLGRGVYEVPLHRQPLFAELARGQAFDAADAFARRHICLPLWRGMDDLVVSEVIKATKAGLQFAARS